MVPIYLAHIALKFSLKTSNSQTLIRGAKAILLDLLRIPFLIKSLGLRQKTDFGKVYSSLSLSLSLSNKLLLKGKVHLQLKLSANAFLNSALKKPYMNGFRALLQYKRMIEECLISVGTVESESIKRITTKGVQENKKVHVTIRNVLNIFISRFSRVL